MQLPWSRDNKDVLESLNYIINDNIPIFLQFNGSQPKRSRIYKMHLYKGVPFLLIQRPSDMECPGSDINSALYKIKGLPVLGFPLTVTRESDKLLGAPLPDQIFQIDLRRHPRIAVPKGSVMTFMFRNKTRVNICQLHDISEGGVKIFGTPVYHIQENDTIGPCTISLAGEDGIIKRELNIHRANIVRAVAGNIPDCNEFGLSFELQENEAEELKENLDYLWWR